jgi:hypothetical protein
METFNNNSLPAFWTLAGEKKKAVPAMSGFVHPPQKHKFLFDGFLQGKRFCKADKTGQPTFHLSKIGRSQSKIVYVSIDYASNGYGTFAVDKIHEINKTQWKS